MAVYLSTVDMDDSDSETRESTGRNSLLLLAKIGFLVIFLIGVLIRIFIPLTNFDHLSTVLMWVGVLGRLFIYVRALNPSVFLPKQNRSPLSLVERRNNIVPSYDRSALTPLERVIVEPDTGDDDRKCGKSL